MKADPYYRRQKCRIMTLVSGGYSGGFSGEAGVRRQWGRRQRQFSAFSLAIFSEPLEMRPALFCSDRHSIVDLSLIPKCMTVNDLEWLFRVKICIRAGLADSDRATSKNNCVKTNKDRHIQSAAQIFDRDSSICNIRFVRKFARGL